MKALGIVRKLDELGRVVIPKEIRRQQGWKQGTPLEMFNDKDGLFIKPYSLGDEDETVRKLEAKKSFIEDVRKQKAFDIVIKELQK